MAASRFLILENPDRTAEVFEKESSLSNDSCCFLSRVKTQIDGLIEGI